MQGGIRLVRQARGVLPEALVLCLCQRGKYRVPEQAEERSELGWTGETLRWKVVELCTLPAEDLLSAANVGVVPWATLAHYDGPPEVLLQRCRDRIERDGGARKASLLAVAQVFAQLKFDKPELLEILGGEKTMLKSPLLQKIGADFERAGQVEALLRLLKERFGPVGPEIEAGLALLKEKEKILGLMLPAATCASLQAFADRLRQELTPPAPASTRGKRRLRKPPA
jgi:hypothetical protein